MLQARSLPPLGRSRRQRVSGRRVASSEVPTAWRTDGGHPVEIVAHDPHCTKLLLEYAAPLFPAEVVAGSAWIVRLQTPAGGRWVLEFLSLVERWLEAARLPCARVVHGGRTYLIRTSPNFHRPSAVVEVTSAPTLARSGR